MEYMAIGHFIKVTNATAKDYKDIGTIISKDGDFVFVDFGTHERTHNVSNLLDLTFKNYIENGN